MKDNLMLLDTHVHTCQVSPCGKVPAKEMIELYKEAGYGGVIITDHYYKGYFESLGNRPWEEKIQSFLSGYKAALERGNALGVKVFLGMEIRFVYGSEDYLVFGLDEDYLLQNPRLYLYTLEDFRDHIQETGALIFQAHPFRPGLTPAAGNLLDGMEVHNGNPRHDSGNDRAYNYAKSNGLMMSSGSDSHQTGDVGRGGIILPGDIDSMDELIRWYRQRPSGIEHIYRNDEM